MIRWTNSTTRSINPDNKSSKESNIKIRKNKIANFVLILISTWTYFPFILIGTLARLQTIDPELYAAAKVDGAGLLRRFFHVTLPQIRNVLFVLIYLACILLVGLPIMVGEIMIGRGYRFLAIDTAYLKCPTKD